RSFKAGGFRRVCCSWRGFGARSEGRSTVNFIRNGSGGFKLRCYWGLRRRLCGVQARLPVRQFACLSASLFDGGAQAFDPNADLSRGPAEYAARPDQFERRKLAPGLVAIDHGARDEIAAHRRGVETVATETAGQPDAWTEFADLRHAMYGNPQGPGPGKVDLDIAQLWIGSLDVGLERSDVTARVARPRRGAARQHQPIAADDAIVIIGGIAVTDAAAITD